MIQSGYTLFATPIGCCGIAWGSHGITRLQLPEASEKATGRRLSRVSGCVELPPPDWVRAVIEDVVALLSGERRNCATARLDYGAAEAFEVAVYEVARGIQPGCTMTYGQLAESLGDRNAARDVGQALGRNPCPIIVPCHRVLAADGRMHGFSGRGGTATKLKLLEIEGWRPDQGPTLFDGIEGFGLALPRRG